jgi:hypothetical protein
MRGHSRLLSASKGGHRNIRKILLIAQFENFFICSGIPSLIILDENNELITSEGRSALGSDKEGAVRDLSFVCGFRCWATV